MTMGEEKGSHTLDIYQITANLFAEYSGSGGGANILDFNGNKFASGMVKL